MFQDIRKNKVFNRRVFMVTAGQALMTGAIVSKLGYLQIFKHKNYSIQSDSNSIKPVFRVADRGVIFDRNGLALTQNEERYQLFMYVESKASIVKNIEILSKTLMLSSNRKHRILRNALRSRRRSMILLIDNLSWNDLSRIESSFYKFDGLSIERHITRKSPHPFSMSHMLGYVSLPTKKDVANAKDLKPVLLSPGFRIGRTGLEKRYDFSLRGKYGVKYVEVNSADKPIRIASEKDSIAGNSLVTTIDARLQDYVFDRLENKVASAVIMDVERGDILSLVSSPSYDINSFAEGVSLDYWNQVSKDPRLPLNNRAISAIYPPGSVFKIITAIAALESGYDPNQIVNCKGHIKYGKRKLHCWKKEGHGKLNLIDAIMQSCNVYFFELAKELGMKKINEVAKRFGFGSDYEIGLDGVSVGNLPDDKWKRKVFGKSWVGGDTLNCAIGQGFVLSTPIQLATVMSRLANGGREVDPRLVISWNGEVKEIEKTSKKSITSAENINLIKEGLERVVNNKKGTAYYQRIREDGYKMAGKTGTSQVISKREDELTKTELKLRKNKNHAIFAGYAPFDNPKYSVAVVVEHGGSGSASAAPIARDILLKAQKLKIL